MFAITGITGNVGGVVARALLDAKQPLRAVVRDPANGVAWAGRGCEVAVADINDAEALAVAFQGVEGVFLMVPSNFDPAPGFPEAHAIAATLRTALEQARPGRIVYLSTIGAQATRSNLLTQHTIIEEALRARSHAIINLPAPPAIPATPARHPPRWFARR
jgi:NAD(P)H dehydrogenase (quinone)